MTDTTTQTLAGDNRGPLITEDQLAIDHASLVAQVEDMLARAEKLPENIDGQAASDLFGAFVIDANEVLKRVDAVRETEKAPYFAATKVVDGFFNAKQRDRLQPHLKRIRATNDQWVYDQAEARRKELAKEAQRLQMIADEQAEAAAAAEAAGKNRVADVKMEGALAAQQEAVAEIKSEGSTLDLSRQTLTGGGTVSVSASDEVKSFDRDKIDLNALRPFLAEDAIMKALAGALKLSNLRFEHVVYGPKIRGNYRAGS